MWVDGLDRVVSVDPAWPQLGGSVTWVSGPAGRGRVIERVRAYEPLGGQTLQVSDDSIEGSQWVRFEPSDDGVEVLLSLEYEIKQRNLFTPLVDFLFIRRAMESSLRTTLAAFGSELDGRRAVAP